ncbi:nucleoside-diphosphate-sugar epimerase [Aminivibrio pyruvatiphilus]|uniref:Nucleoside-diphosphate-sugar epimerase n=1 Tax=Aminivibrio pyruvatiphilus TaxID=1005740 RepID=A0A4R8LW33_9BACT|nr:NAD-dependent epimerase/dehydratase family protein [Aminivibrio pyruvatiphilus]TDY52103.1 nucleoside-diphosphate-sugar epimerase [Aminivibrio pyruvatiphilus]
MRRILVTGAAGYIGRNLCSHLLKNGYEVTGSLLNQKEAELLPEGVKPVVTGAISGKTDWSEALEGADGVVHLAAIVHKKETKNKATEDLFRRTNTDATAALAKQALEKKIRSFVFLSTVAVYGVNKTTEPLTVKSPINPITYYGKSKWEAEQKLTALFEKADASLTIFRPTMVYGPKAPGNFARLSKLVKMGIPLPFGSSNNQRHLLYIERLLEFIIGGLQNTNLGVVVKIASDSNTISTKELILLAAEWEKKKARLFSVPPLILCCLFVLIGKRNEWDKLGASFIVKDS